MSGRSTSLQTGPHKIHIHIMIVGALIVLILSACTRSASKAPAGAATENAPQVAPQTNVATQPQAASKVIIDQVQVNEGAGIYVQGRSTLANGECVKTELLANQQAVDWWPKDICIQVDSGQWEFLAALGSKGAPAQLDPNTVYEIQAWWAKEPEAARAHFPFDLKGPKQLQ